MKLDENFFITLIYQQIAMILEAIHYGTVCYKGMTIYLTRQVSPFSLRSTSFDLTSRAFRIDPGTALFSLRSK